MYAAIGRKQVLMDAQDGAYNALLGVMARVASGEVKPEHLAVDLKARTWAINIPAQDPG